MMSVSVLVVNDHTPKVEDQRYDNTPGKSSLNEGVGYTVQLSVTVDPMS